MITTSSYKDFDTNLYSGVSISKDRGKDADFSGETFLELAPKEAFFRVWKNNRGVIPEDENTRYYVEEYYKQVLSKLDPAEVYRKLEYKTLLCYEDSSEFCHRHLVAAWFNLLLGDTIKPVTEIKMVDGKLEVVGDCGSRYEGLLETVIKKNERMCGFNSVRARYLFDLGEKLEALADEKESADPEHNYDYLRQAACFRRCDADALEEEYRAGQKKLVSEVKK